MRRLSLRAQTGLRQSGGALLLAIAMAATVGGALAFQHGGGYLPCALCLEQRTPYYLGVPVALAAFAAAKLRWPPVVARTLIGVVGLLMLWAFVLGARHAGVEWGWWPGPADCAATGGADLTGNLLDSLDAVRPPSCSQAALRILGLSLAGWNALIALALSLLAATSALGPGDRFAPRR